MDNFSNYDGIRPYYDNEVNKVINSLLEEFEFLYFLRYLFPEVNKNELLEKLSKIDNIKDFQACIAQPALRVVLERSVDSFTFSGFEKIEKDNTYLYVSNHRDIALDPSLFNLLMFESGHDTTQIAIGSNLLVSPVITSMFKLNKSFIVHRDVSPRQLYLYSKQLSSYILELVKNKMSSVWIAQGEGRTKDGNDHTQHGLIRMLTLNKEDSIIEIIKKLNIVPVAISYEFEPCDIGKAEETFCLNNDLPYYKTPEQGINNLLSGMKDYKGRIHISFCEPLNNLIVSMPEVNDPNTDLLTLIAEIIDNEIHSQYKLWPTNYIASDILNNSSQFSENYTDDQKQFFTQHIDKMLEKTKYNKIGVKDVLLKIYSNPVMNSIDINQKKNS
jgi:1-acyl-sn-glycerol-3-phosphate acyltransferase